MSKTTLEKLKKQRQALDARIQAAEARAKESDRKKDTRRKILVGSYYLDQAAKNNKMDELKKELDNFLKRNSDRRLFELAEINE